MSDTGGEEEGVDVRGLRVSVSGTDVEIVRGVNVRVARGEIFGLVGESGSGKTSLGLALLGYARPGTRIAGGTVEIAGMDLLSCSDKRRRTLRGALVSYVPQDPASALNPSMRVGKQLEDVLREHGYGRTDRHARMREVLEAVSLPADPAFLARYPHQLSGGQQQRIAIGISFACHPTLIVMDEPTTGLDVTTQAHILDTVRDVARASRSSVVYISHDLAVVAGVATRIGVMYAGELVEVGQASTVLHNAGHPYTRRLVAAAPDSQQRRPLVAIPGSVPPIGLRTIGCRFADRCELAEDACESGPISEEVVDSAADHWVRCRRWRTLMARAGASVVNGDGQPGQQSTPSIALRVERLSAWYGEHRVLQEVSLSLPRGSCVALVGESGSGKTTLSRCISGMHVRAEGEVRLGDAVLPADARQRSAAQRRAIQYIFQNPFGSLNPRKTVRELIEHPLRCFSSLTREDPVPELLEQVSLRPVFARRYPSQLSGGERQRVAIARALAVGPEILICDEITSSLDVSVQASILNLLAKLHTENELTVLFVTHNLAVVRAIADDVTVLEEGKVVEQGNAGDVIERPREDYTQRLVANTPRIG
jgi:peptide/nickel transport system ATP-binding protein